MCLIKELSLKFPDVEMEKQYSKVKRLDAYTNFRFTLIFLIFMAALLVLFEGIHSNYTDMYIAIATLCALLVVFMIGYTLTCYLQYLALFAILAYNVSRLILIQRQYDSTTKAFFFFNGYVFATIQSVVISRINNVMHRFLAMFVFLALRCGIIIGVIDPSSAEPMSIIRQVCVDIFLVYTFYCAQRTERLVFRNFYEDNKELTQFKKLLDDSLPISVAVIDCKDNHVVFRNKMFLKTFDNWDGKSYHDLIGEHAAINLINRTSLFPYLMVDLGTVIEMGTVENSPSRIYSDENTLSLKETIKMLVKSNVLKDKALSLTAFYDTNNQQQIFEVTLKRVPWERADAVAIILNDITFHENLMALKMANISKDKIIATISHELRTPIHGIVGILQTTQQKVEDPQVLSCLSLCRNNADLLLNLINSVIDYHQISTNKLRLKPTSISIRETLRQVLEIFGFQCQQKGLSIDLEVKEDVPTHIVTDEGRLKEILVNIIANAVKFTFQGGITIRAACDLEESNYMKISITDTGIGMTEKVIARLFQLQGLTGSKGSVNKNGVGFGLSISNALVRKLSGKEDDVVIKVESEEQKGTTFSFQILQNLGSAKNNPAYEANIKAQYSAIVEKDELASHTTEKERKECTRSDNTLDLDFTNEYEEFSVPMDIESKIVSHSLSNMVSSVEILHPSSRVFPRPAHQGNRNQEGPERVLEIKEEKYEDEPSVLEKETIKALNRDGTTEEGKKKQILVVDDNPFNLLIAQNLLKDLDYSIQTAGGGHQAIEMMKAMKKNGDDVKAILMDCQMPVMDGYETTRILIDTMKRNEIQKVPVLAWTANNSDEDIERCYECGMIAHLSKPTSKEEVLKVLSKLE